MARQRQRTCLGSNSGTRWQCEAVRALVESRGGARELGKQQHAAEREAQWQHGNGGLTEVISTCGHIVAAFYRELEWRRRSCFTSKAM